MSDYKASLHLPKTDFPMKANLRQREPEILKQWEEGDAYGAMLAASGAQGSYGLHDGPPYANGHIHLGTALNKILKDIIIKARNMQGYKAEYVPGWDCHGLPIEHKVEQELGERRHAMSVLDIRARCRDYAKVYIDIQRDEFRRLGVLGVWEAPYLSMDPSYESATAMALARFVETGGVVRGKKPIYWCCSCETALAEAEVEYADERSPSIYVRFPLTDPGLRACFPQADPARTSIVIWTTTPWTLPGNLAVALHPEFAYALVEADGAFYILAKELWESCAALLAGTGRNSWPKRRAAPWKGWRRGIPFTTALPRWRSAGMSRWTRGRAASIPRRGTDAKTMKWRWPTSWTCFRRWTARDALWSRCPCLRV
jgi:isoleucyl-tRNA synthetase